MKKIFRLTESELQDYIRQSAQKIISEIALKQRIDKAAQNAINEMVDEIGDTPKGQYHIGRLGGRKMYQGKDDEFDQIHRYAHDKNFNQDELDYDPMLKGAYDDGYEDQYNLEKAKDQMQNNMDFYSRQ